MTEETVEDIFKKFNKGEKKKESPEEKKDETKKESPKVDKKKEEFPKVVEEVKTTEKVEPEKKEEKKVEETQKSEPEPKELETIEKEDVGEIKVEDLPKEEEKTIKTISKGEDGTEEERAISKEELIGTEEVEKIEFPKEITSEKPIEIPTEKINIPLKPEDEEFDLSDAQMPLSINWMIYSRKGEGKTSLGFSIPGDHNCISFDNKSQAIKEQRVEKGLDKPDRITVKDGVKYINESSPDSKLESSDLNWRYLNKLIEKLDTKDWCVVDGGEIFHGMAEMVMRYRNNLMPFEGVKNRNIWKERNMYISQLFHACLRKSKKGVIWTAYVDIDEVIEEGEFVTKKEVPKWISSVLYESDIVIRCETKKNNAGIIEFFATVESCKIPDEVLKRVLGGNLIKGKQINTTGKGFEALLQKES